MCSFFFFFLPDRPTHLHEREGNGKRNILLGWSKWEHHLFGGFYLSVQGSSCEAEFHCRWLTNLAKFSSRTERAVGGSRKKPRFHRSCWQDFAHSSDKFSSLRLYSGWNFHFEKLILDQCFAQHYHWTRVAICIGNRPKQKCCALRDGLYGCPPCWLLEPQARSGQLGCRGSTKEVSLFTPSDSFFFHGN